MNATQRQQQQANEVTYRQKDVQLNRYNSRVAPVISKLSKNSKQVAFYFQAITNQTIN